MFVCSTQTFFGTSGKNVFLFFFAPFSSENHDFPIAQQCKKKNKKRMQFFFPTYPTKKYRVGVQQTNDFFKDVLNYAVIKQVIRSSVFLSFHYNNGIIRRDRGDYEYEAEVTRGRPD